MDINDLLKQAQSLQKKMEKMSEEMAAKEYQGEASGGLVKVVLMGDFSLKSVFISPDILHEDDKEMVEELIVIAYANAKKEVEKDSGSKMSGLGLPF